MYRWKQCSVGYEHVINSWQLRNQHWIHEWTGCKITLYKYSPVEVETKHNLNPTFSVRFCIWRAFHISWRVFLCLSTVPLSWPFFLLSLSLPVPHILILHSPLPLLVFVLLWLLFGLFATVGCWGCGGCWEKIGAGSEGAGCVTFGLLPACGALVQGKVLGSAALGCAGRVGVRARGRVGHRGLGRRTWAGCVHWRSWSFLLRFCRRAAFWRARSSSAAEVGDTGFLGHQRVDEVTLRLALLRQKMARTTLWPQIK